MEPIRERKHIKTGYCTSLGCSNKTQGRKFCANCRSKQSRLKDPERYAYNNVKSRARKANIPFTITLEQFREFCVRTEYMVGKGKTIGSYNVDRIIEGPLPGYTIENIQCLDKQKNIKKYLDYNWQTRQAKAIQYNIPTVENVEDLPF